MRILVVEDEVEWRNTIKLALKPPQYDVITASNYDEALNRLEEDYDLIIIDMRLGENPYYAGELLLSDITNRNIRTPCIVLTQSFLSTVDILNKYRNVVNVVVKGDTDLVSLREIVARNKKNDMTENYKDFELHITPEGDVTARSEEGVSQRVSIGANIPIQLRLTQALLENRQNTNAELLKTFGQALYELLFPGPIHAHLQQTEAAARAHGAKVRLRLFVEHNDVAKLPLEFLYRELGGYFFAVNPSTVLSRYLSVPLPLNRARRPNEPLHLLTIIADPTDQVRINPDEWESLMRNALKMPLAQNLLTIHIVKRSTRKEIRDALLQKKPDIIQFVGHGVYQNGKGYLALVDETSGKTWMIDDERFANLFLGADDHLRLVSLATCESAKSDSPQGFLGIAPQIVQRGVPAVVAMQYSVLIRTAAIFLEDFYTSIAASKPLDWAIQSARNAVSQELGLDNREFATPALYMRAKDGEVF